MTKYFEKKLYEYELEAITDNHYISNLKNKTIVITGANGLIGSMLIDVIMYANQKLSLDCKVYGVVRNFAKAKERFKFYEKSNMFKLLNADINKDEIIINKNIDYFVHGASNTHPISYSSKPIETILTNTIGTNNTLKFASEHNCKKYVFLSTVEVYGENRGDVEQFSEDYCGYIDCNTLRAGYSESKRVGESLCQAYIKEHNIECVIARIARCYGPGILEDDSKALSQFLRKGISNEDIVLKSKGDQFYSFVYVADVVDSILFMLQNSNNGEAYNIVGKNSNITLLELANLVAKNVKTKVTLDLPDYVELAGYSKVTNAILSPLKIENLGWSAKYTLENGLKDTIDILKK